MGRTSPPNTGLRIEGPSSGVKRLPPRTRYAPSNGPPPGPAAVGSRGLKGISLHVVPSSHVACLPALRRAVGSFSPPSPLGGRGGGVGDHGSLAVTLSRRPLRSHHAAMSLRLPDLYHRCHYRRSYRDNQSACYMMVIHSARRSYIPLAGHTFRSQVIHSARRSYIPLASLLVCMPGIMPPGASILGLGGPCLELCSAPSKREPCGPLAAVQDACLRGCLHLSLHVAATAASHTVLHIPPHTRGCGPGSWLRLCSTWQLKRCSAFQLATMFAAMGAAAVECARSAERARRAAVGRVIARFGAKSQRRTHGVRERGSGSMACAAAPPRWPASLCRRRVRPGVASGRSRSVCECA